MFLKHLKTLLRCGIKLIIFLLIMHFIPFNLSFAQDWTITSVEVVKDSTIILDKDLIIKNNGHLTLSNVNLTMNCQYDGEFRIEVEPGGCFFVDSCKIQAADSDKGYAFLVAGDSLQICNSTIQHVGCGPEHEGIASEEVAQGKRGLTIKSPHATIEGNTFSHNEIALVLTDSGTVVLDNTFHDNIVHTIYINYAEDILDWHT